MYPLMRNRRLRSSSAIRHLVRETILTPSDFFGAALCGGRPWHQRGDSLYAQLL
jgi:hypothetical protein